MVLEEYLNVVMVGKMLDVFLVSDSPAGEKPPVACTVGKALSGHKLDDSRISGNATNALKHHLSPHPG